MVGLDGLEPSTSRLSGARSNLLSYRPVFPFPFRSSKASRGFAPSPYLTIGGDDGIRTHDPLLAGQVLSQLSYTPSVSLLPFLGPWKLNNNLSRLSCTSALLPSHLFLLYALRRYLYLLHLFGYFFIYYLLVLHRKEVIQQHLPIRLPCYDLTPIIEPTFDCCSLAVGSQASGVPNFHGLTGGVYKARERIHRGMLIRDY